MRRPTTARMAAGVLAAAVLALAACGDDSGVSTGDQNVATSADEPDSGDETTTSTSVAPTTAATETTTTTAPPAETTTTAPAPTVPETSSPPTEAPTTAPAPDGVVCGTLDPLIGSADILSSGTVDWNGDGTAALATVYDTAPGAGDFRLRVDTGSGGSEVAIITDGLVAPSYLGPVQVDFSLGSDEPQPQEMLLVVGANSSGPNLGVFFRDDLGCIGRFRGADELDLVLPIHSSVGSASGLACEGAAGSQFLVRTTAEASAGSGEYDVHDIRLRRDGDQLLDDVDLPGFIIDDGSPTSPFLRYSGITNCGF